MPNYTKLFNSIVTSTIWTEDDKTRIVWITMLAIADQHGEVQASIPGLARVAGVSVEAAETAINKFLSPDSYSRTPDDEGRRIEKIDGGWLLLNHAKYRAMASKEDLKAANVNRQRRYREKLERNASVTPCNASVTPCNASVTPCNASVTPCNASVTQERDIAEAEAEAEAYTEAMEEIEKDSCAVGAPTLASKKSRVKFTKPSIDELRSYAKEIGLPESDGDSMFEHWEGNGWKNGANRVVCWKSTMRRWERGGWHTSQKALKQSNQMSFGTKPQSSLADRNPNAKRENIKFDQSHIFQLPQTND